MIIMQVSKIVSNNFLQIFCQLNVRLVAKKLIQLLDVIMFLFLFPRVGRL